MKKGYQTTEFWTSLMACAAGLGLMAWGVVSGEEQGMYVGGAVLSTVVPSYTFARTSAKKKPKGGG